MTPISRLSKQQGEFLLFYRVPWKKRHYAHLYERVDGVLLPGGGDIFPSFYNQESHPQSRLIDKERDQMEFRITQWAVAEDRPVFGICRGHQVFNVANGGTLIQDIPDQVKTELQHDITPGMQRNTRLHTITVAEDSLLARVMEGTSFSVNSLHHQAIQDVAPNLTVSAHAPDGIVEATEIPGHPFALTVQWHPEDMVGDDTAMQRLFQSFVAAAAARMNG